MIINEFLKGLVDAEQICLDDLAMYSGYNVRHVEDIINKKVSMTPREANILLKVLGYRLEDVLIAY